MVPLRKAIAMTGLTGNTLRKYADSGAIPSVRTPGGQRLFDVDVWLRNSRQPATVGYCRVDSSSQRDGLESQAALIHKAYPQAEIITDMGSGFDGKRPGLRRLLERLLHGERIVLLLAQADRLAGFGIDIIRFLVEKNGGEILVLAPPTLVEEPQLAEILALIHERFGSEGSAMSPKQALEKLWGMIDESGKI